MTSTNFYMQGGGGGGPGFLEKGEHSLFWFYLIFFKYLMEMK